MKLRHLLVFAALVSLVYGLALLFAPAVLLAWYGLSQGAAEVLMSRFFGAALIGLGLVSWLGRGEGAAGKIIVPSFLIGALAGLVVAVYGVINGVMNTLGWSVVIIYLLLVLGFAYFQLKKA